MAFEVAAIVGIAAAMLLSAVPSGEFVTSTGSAGSVSPLAPAPSVPSAPVSSSALPGAHPTGVYSNSPQLAQAEEFHNLTVTSALRAEAAQENATRAAASARLTKDESELTGRLSGFVNTSVANSIGQRLGLSGIAVQAYSLSGELCSPQICVAGSSSATGYFNVVAPVGTDYLVFTANYYLSNTSYATVANDSTTYSGTTYLVHEATITGYVMTDTPIPQPVPGVVVSSASLNDTQVGTPIGTTTENGSFTAAVPPVPSTVQFQSPFYAFQGNFTWVNATPGASVDLGTIYLEAYDSFRASIYDAATRQLISGSWASLQVCSSISGQCAEQGAASQTGELSAFGPPGNDYIILQAEGYVQLTQSIGFVAKENPGQVVNLGAFYLTPPGTVQLTVSLDYDASNPQDQANVTSLENDFHTGLWRASVCSADGYKVGTIVAGVIQNTEVVINTSISNCISGGCQQVGEPGELAALPLQNYILITPDYTPFCDPPYPTWPIPGDLPVYPTTAWANVTPYETTYVNASMPVGTYIAGNVYLQGTNEAPPGGFVVTATSTSYTVSPGVSYSYVDQLSAFDCSPYVDTATAFCVPAPPGPVQIEASGAESASNTTWASTESLCCDTKQFPLALSTANNEHVQSINLTGSVMVSGLVEEAGGTEPVPFASLEICPLDGLNCFSNVTLINGTFDVPGPPGWGYITVSASGYAPNTVWANVSSEGTTSVGPIFLTPLGTLTGLVLDPEGQPILDAHASVCPITAQLVCETILGSGRVSTGGQYLGLLPGGWLPGSTYKIEVTASGYSTDWTWANVTSNETTVLPPIVLQPVGANANSTASDASASAASAPSSASNAGGAWLTGRVVDASTGWGVAVQATEFVLTSPGAIGGVGFSSGANTGGFFNQSIPSGLFYLNLSVPGYEPFSEFINASVALAVDVGVLPLEPLPWISGNVTSTPWFDIATPVGHFDLAPPAQVTVCTASGVFVCSQQPVESTYLNGTGYYRVQSPSLGPMNVSAIGLGGGPYTGGGGFVFGYTIVGVNVSGQSIATFQMGDFSSYSGYVMDQTMGNGQGVRYAPVSIQVGGPGTRGGTASGPASAQGYYVLFASPYTGDPDHDGSHLIQVLATTPNAYVSGAAYYDNSSAGEPGQSIAMPTMYLEHYGYVEFRVVSSNGAPVPTPGVFSSVLATSGSYEASSGIGNQNGWVNTTAPPGDHVELLVSADSEGPFNSTTFYLNVSPSRTTFAAGGSGIHLGAIVLQSFGYTASSQVNSSSTPVLASVKDAANHQPLPNAEIDVTNSGGTSASLNPQPTNEEGQFLENAPAGEDDLLTVSHPAYESVVLALNVHPGAFTNVTSVNLTGDGVIAGQVIGYPSNAPISGALVVACSPGETICPSAESNISGDFWVAAAPGTVFVNVSATDFDSNGTELKLCSDCWQHLAGAIHLDAFASFSGLVLGLPAGYPIVGAQVQVCAAAGACFAPSLSDSAGRIVDVEPPGTYTMDVSAAGFSPASLGIVLTPGESLDLGTIFLNEFGTVEGSVVNSATRDPVVGAQVLLCGTATGASCAPQSLSDASGAFAVQGPAGASQLIVSAPGYATDFGTVGVLSGAVVTLPAPIDLVPLGQDVAYTVSGRVETASGPFGVGGSPLGGAVVALLVNGTPAFSTETGASGSFQLSASVGEYVLSIFLPGFAVLAEPMEVSSPTSLGDLLLSVQTYDVSGIVADGYTGAGLANVSIGLVAANGTWVPLATSAADGSFSTELPNGSWSIRAVPAPSSTVPYAPVTFPIQIDGAAQSLPIDLLPPQTAIYGLVADQTSGLPIVGAQVTVQGVAVDGHSVQLSFVSSANGTFRIVLPEGQYTFDASALGYVTLRQGVDATGSTGSVVLALGGMPGTSPSSGSAISLGGWELLIVTAAAIGGVGATILGLRLRGRRTRPAREARPATDEGGEER